MTQIMTPSKTTTAGQIDKAVANYRALLEKHSREFNAEVMQTVLGQSELTEEQFAVLRRRVEAMSNLIVRCAKVNRNRTPQEALDATGRKKYTDESVVEAMPKGKDKEVEVIFFKPRPEAYRDGWLSDEALDKEFEFFGLEQADPYSVAAVNEADPAFADEYPNATHWKANGKWCYAAFYRWLDGRSVRVYRDGSDWFDDWWFAGFRK